MKKTLILTFLILFLNPLLSHAYSEDKSSVLRTVISLLLTPFEHFLLTEKFSWIFIILLAIALFLIWIFLLKFLVRVIIMKLKNRIAICSFKNMFMFMLFSYITTMFIIPYCTSLFKAASLLIYLS
jgi:hypothetical protein